MADASANVYRLTCPIGGPIGVDVPLSGKPPSDAHVLQVDHVGGHVAVGHGEHADVAGVLELLVFVLKHAVLAGSPLGKDFAAVGYQQPCAGPRLAGDHVLGEDKHLVAGTLGDYVQIALRKQRGGL